MSCIKRGVQVLSTAAYSLFPIDTIYSNNLILLIYLFVIFLVREIFRDSV